MQRNRNILTGLLMVQIVLILLLRSPFSDARTATEPRPLLPALEQITASRLEIDGKEGATITLLKEGENWTLEEPGGFPADGEKIDSLIEKLRQLVVRRPVISSGRYHEAFEIEQDANNGRVRVFGDGKEVAADVILGTAPNYRSIHLRQADAPEVFEVRGLAAYDVRAEAAFWADKQLVSVPTGEVVGLTLSNAAGRFELARTEDGWVASSPEALAGAALDGDAVDTLLRAAASIRIDAPAGLVDEVTQGLGAPAATVELRFAAGDGGSGSVSYRIGGNVADKETHRYVSRDGMRHAGTIWESSIRQLLDETVEALRDKGVEEES